ncbi:MAG TPA: glycosyltransferase [Candidatus Saccharimonadales bacterium]|nr:glycosyltransferase [Candidatus Saccharimonadales bacterium]
MKVSVIIPVYNEEAYIQACLESVIAQKEPADEIIVVDNNSQDNTIAIAKTFPGIRIVKEKNQGMIPARNRGFSSASYEIIARTDADARVPKDWIKRIKKNFKDTSVIAVSGTMHFYSSPVIAKVSQWPTNIFLKATRSAIRHNILVGPNMALRKSAWELVKDEVCMEDKDVHEDIDLALHLAAYGEIKFDNKSVVKASFRRYKKLITYFDYPYRSIKTIRRHKKTLLEIQSRRLVKKVFLRSKTIMKHLQQIPNQL